MNITLTIIGDRNGKRDASFPSPGEYIFGRGEEADCQVNDGRVSKEHCKLIVAGPEARLRDLNSTNGTTVDGVALGGTASAPHVSEAPQPTIGEDTDAVYSARKEMPLREGSIILMGSTRLIVHFDEGAADREMSARLMAEGEQALADAADRFARALQADPENRRAKTLSEMLSFVTEKMALDRRPSGRDTDADAS